MGSRILFIDVHSEIRMTISRMIQKCCANPLTEPLRVDKQHFDLRFAHADEPADTAIGIFARPYVHACR